MSELETPIPQTNANRIITGANPVEGGPVTMPATSTVKQQLAQELAGAQQVAQQTQRKLGVMPTATGEQQFQESGIRIGREVVAQDELKRALELQQKAIKNYVQSAGFSDQLSQTLAEDILNNKLNKLRLELIKRGQAFDARLKQMQISDAQRAAAAKNFGAMAGAITGAVIGSYGGPAGVMAGTQLGGQLGAGLGGFAGGGQMPERGND